MDSPPPPAGRRLHPVDAIALLLVLAAAATAWAFLGRRAPPPRPVDDLLGSRVEVEFRADLPWKESFPAPGERVLLDEYLEAEVLSAGASARAGFRHVDLRVLGRNEQQPAAVNEFRWGVWRGSTLGLRSRGDGGKPISALETEVVAVAPAGK